MDEHAAGTTHEHGAHSDAVHEPRSAPATLRLAVLAYSVVNVGYGLPMLVWPTLLWGTIAGASGAARDGLVSVRWAGAVLVAHGIGAILVFLRPKGQRTYVTAMTLQVTLAAIAIGASIVLGELDVLAVWFRFVSLIVVGLTAIYLWIARWRARELLGT
ncbi:MAG: hypothetical protein HKN07_06970 [Acidimicrobiia bacterium]|nr:hypothetical protein [Acidimicrobiia bacterium]NNF63986.1 hypothetical protein [Acidimicrobiia bacterium]